MLKKVSHMTSFVGSSVASNIASRALISEGRSGAQFEENVVKQLLSHVPDSIVYFNHNQEMPALKEFVGVVLFADISGFTALTEKYSNLATSDGTSGTDKLSATLNAYIGKIVNEIISNGGDILKFAGDAILATWRCSDIGHNATSILNKVIKCSIRIQETCDNYETEVGITLHVKLAIAVGPMCLTYVGLDAAKQFDLSGSAVDDVGLTEKQATPGAIILSQLAWANCNQNKFEAFPMADGKFYKIKGYAYGDKNVNINLKDNQKMAAFFQGTQRVVTSPMDELIDQCVGYLQDMPKALMQDEEEKAKSNIFVRNKIEVKKSSNVKKKKFDRVTMAVNLHPEEITHLRAYVPEPVLYKLDHGQDLEWLSEMRHVSVLFINMKLPDAPKEAAESLQKAFEVVYESCVKFKGNLNKVFGFDKGCTFVVIFGLPGQKHEDGAYRALCCAHHIYDSLHAIAEIINESIGVTTGLAFCGVVGHKDRHEYTVIGSKVNMAARLMMYYPNKLTCDNQTYEAAISRLRKQDFIEMPFIELKGLKDPGVVREYDPNTSKNVETSVFNYSILGRQKEIDAFKCLIDFTKNNSHLESNILIVEGEAGVGKTRLLEEFMNEATKQHIRVVSLEGNLSHQKTSRYIANKLLTALLQLDDDFRCRRIVGLIHNNIADFQDIVLLHDIFGPHLPYVERKYEIKDSEMTSRRFTVYVKLIKLVLLDEPTCFVIDNARYVDDESWKFLKQLVSCPNGIFCFAVRSSASATRLCEDARHVIAGGQAFKITGLGNQDLIDFVCQLLEVNFIPRRLADIAQTRSQGIPSWCKQLVKDMMDSSILQLVPRSLLNEKSKPKKAAVVITLNGKEVSEAGSGKLENTTVNSEDLTKGDCKYEDANMAKASKTAVPFESEEICVLSSQADLKAMVAPSSVKDMVLARMDRMTLSEQTILKCAAVLGQSFTRDVLKAIIPKNCVNMLDTTLYTLGKQQFFECGSLAIQATQERNQSSIDIPLQMDKQPSALKLLTQGVQGVSNIQVLCGCYAYEGFPVINLSQANTFSDNKKRACLFFQFSNTFVQETAYALWLEDQRKTLFEKAALHLERSSHKCRSCGGNGFIPGHGRGISVNEQLKHGVARRFSTSVQYQQRTSRAVSRILTATDNQQLLANVREEAQRILKNCKSEHIKNHAPTASSGERIGLALIQMARIHALKKESESSKSDDKTKLSRFYRQTSRVGNGGPVSHLAAKTLLMEFRNAENDQGVTKTRRNDNNIFEACDIDLSQCQCSELNFRILPQLVFFWKAAGNLLKAFHYTIDAAAAALVVDNSMKALALLKEVEALIKQQEKNNYSDFLVTDEERARIESLKGQAKSSLNFIDEGIGHFEEALRYLGAPQPSTWLNRVARTMKASLVQTLHQKMPGVFMDTRNDDAESLLEQVRCLNFLSKAYTLRGDHDKAYLANLEQINAAEETNDSCWNELVDAYANMVASCQLYQKYSMGRVYQEMLLEKSRLVSLNVEHLLTLGSSYLTLTSFNIADGNLNKALTTAQSCHRVANQINDLNLKISIMPLLSLLFLMKLRNQSCSEVLKSFKEIVSSLDNHMANWMYFYCCAEVFLFSGDAIEHPQDIMQFIRSNETDLQTKWLKICLKNCLALRFMRESNWSLAETYFNKLKESDFLSIGERSQMIAFRALSIQTEYELLDYHRLPCNDLLQSAQMSLKIFKHCNSGNQIFQGRLFHMQAYLAYLRGRENRSKLLLEDCMVICKNNELLYDLEWAMASKSTWQSQADETVDVEQNINSVRYILPPIEILN